MIWVYLMLAYLAGLASPLGLSLYVMHNPRALGVIMGKMTALMMKHMRNGQQ